MAHCDVIIKGYPQTVASTTETERSNKVKSQNLFDIENKVDHDKGVISNFIKCLSHSCESSQSTMSGKFVNLLSHHATSFEKALINETLSLANL